MHHLFPAGIKWVVDSFCLCMRLSFTPPHLLFLRPNFLWQPSVCCQAVWGWQRAVSASLLIRLIALSLWLTYCLSVDDMILLKFVLLSMWLCCCSVSPRSFSACLSACVTLWPVTQSSSIKNRGRSSMIECKQVGRETGLQDMDCRHFKLCLHLMGNRCQNSCF